MPDIMTREQRSERMSHYEQGFQTRETSSLLLHRLGFRFRLHDASLPGKPDIVLRRHAKTHPDARVLLAPSRSLPPSLHSHEQPRFLARRPRRPFAETANPAIRQGQHVLAARDPVSPGFQYLGRQVVATAGVSRIGADPR